jgi:hypothetical protein
MSAIPFVREFEFEYGRCDRLSERVRRIVANNPGPFTYTGTGVYIIGSGEVAVIDPGPALPDHEAALDAALEGEQVTHVLVTHHHLDHSPLAHTLAKKHGAHVYAMSPPSTLPEGGEVRMEAGDDSGFKPDLEVEDGDVFDRPGLDAARPAHAGPYLQPCLLRAGGRAHAVFRRPCDGLVHLGGEPAGRLDGRLYRPAGADPRHGVQHHPPDPWARHRSPAALSWTPISSTAASASVRSWRR